MTRIRDLAIKCVLRCGLALAAFVPLGSAQASKFNVLYTFTGRSDGGRPIGGVMLRRRNLYGSTEAGGTFKDGAVFRLGPDGTETVLHSFNGSDGAHPFSRLIADKGGNLYGTAIEGGGSSNCYGGCGTVFKIAPDGTATVLHAFRGSDGANPHGDLIADSAHALYGTTGYGGTSGFGTIFKLTRNGKLSVLHTFAGGTDGATSQSGLIADASGNFYGTTYFGGGSSNCSGGCGTVFRLAPDGTVTVLHAFTGGGGDGAHPTADLMADAQGNLYGTTLQGGGTFCKSYGCGTVFRLATDGTESLLYAFTGGSDGANPSGSLIADTAGNLYSTTQGGGAKGYGTIFKLAPDGTETVLHSFNDNGDGAMPTSGLILDKAGNLFGSTEGKVGRMPTYGTVFKFKARIVEP
jgi:uncharacterized repeat protein (TIGR03803 family)